MPCPNFAGRISGHFQAAKIAAAISNEWFALMPQEGVAESLINLMTFCITNAAVCHGNLYLDCKINGLTASPCGGQPSPTATTCTAGKLEDGSPNLFVGAGDPPIYLAYGEEDADAPLSSGSDIAFRYLNQIYGISTKVWWDVIEDGPHSTQYDGIHTASFQGFLDRIKTPSATICCSIDYCPSGIPACP